MIVNIGRPRRAKNLRKIRSVRLPPELIIAAEKRAGGLTAAIEQALTEWLKK